MRVAFNRPCGATQLILRVCWLKVVAVVVAVVQIEMWMLAALFV